MGTRVAAAANRRGLLKGGGAALALGAFRLRYPAAAGAQDVASPTIDFCVLTPELTKGPYYLPLDLIRDDITEGAPGLPLRLQVLVADLANGCLPLANAAVDIWHCDAQGTTPASMAIRVAAPARRPERARRREHSCAAFN